MKTRIIASIATAAALVSAASSNAQEITYEINLGVESEYHFRGVQIADESFQGSIEAQFGDAYAGVWASEGIDSIDSNSSEFDFYAGWGFAANDTVTLDFGGTLYHYPDAKGDDSFETYIGANFDTALAPSLYAYYDFDYEVATFEGAIGHSIGINDTSSFELGAALGYVKGSGVEYTYYGATADYVYALSETSSFSIGLRIGDTSGLSEFTTQERSAFTDGNIWGGLSYTAGF